MDKVHCFKVTAAVTAAYPNASVGLCPPCKMFVKILRDQDNPSEALEFQQDCSEYVDLFPKEISMVVTVKYVMLLISIDHVDKVKFENPVPV